MMIRLRRGRYLRDRREDGLVEQGVARDFLEIVEHELRSPSGRRLNSSRKYRRAKPDSSGRYSGVNSGRSGLPGAKGRAAWLR